MPDWEAQIYLKQSELSKLVLQRDELNRSILLLEADIRKLASLHLQDIVAQQADEKRASVVGLTDAIWSVLRITGTPLTAADVKQRLEWMGFNFSGFKNPSAAVHNTLRRLVDQNQVIYFQRGKMYLPVSLWNSWMEKKK